MSRSFLSALLAGAVLFSGTAYAQNNTIDARPGITPPVATGDELLVWDISTSATVKATVQQLYNLLQVGGDCSGTGGPVVSIVCNMDASKITSGTFAAARLPAPTSSTLGGVESAAPVAHQWVQSISTSGVPSTAQPSAADLSDGTHSMTGADIGNAIRNGAAPTSITSCGTSPSFGTLSTDYGGTVNVGTGTVVACTINFAATHNPILRCWIEPSNGAPVATATAVTTTALVVAFATSLGTGRFDYGCTN
jgi:hypothetical protein